MGLNVDELLDIPKPVEGAFEPKTGAPVFVPNDGVVGFPNTVLFSLTNTDLFSFPNIGLFSIPNP